MQELGTAVEGELLQTDHPLPSRLARFGGDLEQMLSYLADRQPWLDPADALRNRGAFLDVSRTVARILRERQMKAVLEPEPAWLDDLIAHWDRTRSTVMSFNYDVLVEAAALQNGATKSWSGLYRAPVVPAGARTGSVWGGPAPKTFALLKLHGSVTWHWSGDDSIPSDPIYDVGLNGGWSAEGLESPYKDSLSVLVSDKVPMVVPPTATKSAFYANAVLRSQWMAAANALEEADELVIIGYSLPPSDTVVRSLLRTRFSGRTVIQSIVATQYSLRSDRSLATTSSTPSAVMTTLLRPSSEDTACDVAQSARALSPRPAPARTRGHGGVVTSAVGD